MTDRRPTPVLRRALTLALTLGVLALAACSATSSTPTAGQNGVEAAGAASERANGVPSDFVRGAASLSDDICTVQNEPIAGVLHVEDLRTVGLLMLDQGYSSPGGGTFSAANYPEKGQINCGADLSETRNFYLELHRNGRGIAANNTLLSTHDIGGTAVDVYRSANDRATATVVVEVKYPDTDSTVGEASLLLQVDDRGDGPTDVEATAAALLQIAEIVVPRVTYNPSPAVLPTPVPAATAPSWWAGCDDGNFVLAGQGPEALLAALGESAYESVGSRTSPLDLGWLVDCRFTTADGNRLSIETYTSASLDSYNYDLFLADNQADAEVTTTTTTIQGRPAVVVADPFSGIVPEGTVFVEIDGVGVFIQLELWDTSGPYSAEAVRAADLTVAAATVFLSNF